MIDAVRHQQQQIARHRDVARGDLRMALLRVEARWSNFASWLYGDIGDREAREAATRRTLDLAREADYSEVTAYALQKQVRWAIMDGDRRRAVALAHQALDVRDASPQTRVLSTLTAGQALTFAGDGPGSADWLREAEALLEAPEDRRDPLGPVATVENSLCYIAGDMARCRLWLDPPRLWPRMRTSSTTGRASMYVIGGSRKPASRWPASPSTNAIAPRPRAARRWPSRGPRKRDCSSRAEGASRSAGSRLTERVARPAPPNRAASRHRGATLHPPEPVRSTFVYDHPVIAPMSLQSPRS